MSGCVCSVCRSTSVSPGRRRPVDSHSANATVNALHRAASQSPVRFPLISTTTHTAKTTHTAADTFRLSTAAVREYVACVLVKLWRDRQLIESLGALCGMLLAHV